MSDLSYRSALASPAAWARRLGYATAAGVFLGAVGAFGTFVAAPLPNRIADWVLMFWVGTLLYPPITALAVIQGRQWNMLPWITVPIAVAVASLPMTLAAMVATSVFIHPTAPGQALSTYFQVVLVALPVVGAYVAFSLSRSAADPGPAPTGPPAPPPAQPRFLARLPGRLGQDLLCLQMEDHYVRVHTALGSDLILMRMRDAVAELDGAEGIQVHRSWWVAAGAVADRTPGERRATLHLRNGLDVPVARSALPAVKAAGWI